MLQRITRRSRSPEERDQLVERLRRLNPDDWGNEGAVYGGVDYPIHVTSSGGRYRFQDDQETPDTHVVCFNFEGRKRSQQAEQGIESLRDVPPPIRHSMIVSVRASRSLRSAERLRPAGREPCVRQAERRMRRPTLLLHRGGCLAHG